MIMRFIDRVPMGRYLVVVAALLFFVALIFFVPPEQVTKYETAILLVLAVAICFGWWRALRIYFQRYASPGATWLGLGIITLWLGVVVSHAFTFYMRNISALPVSLNASPVTAFVHYLYDISAFCIYMTAADDGGTTIPIRRTAFGVLLVMVAIAIAAGLRTILGHDIL